MAKKWNSDATSSEKLLLLFATLLFNDRAFSLAELSSSERLNASKATVLRLLRQLESAKIGVIIREKRGRESFYRLEHNSPPAFSLNPEALSQLALCRDLILHLLPENLRDNTAMALARLGSLTKTIPCLPAASLVRGRIDYDPFQGILSDLEKAIREKMVCKIVYRAAQKQEERTHLFAPKRLLAYHETIYAEGWLLDDETPAQRKYDDPLRLALQRFKSCELTGISSGDFPELPALQDNSFGFFVEEPFMAKIRFSGDIAYYIMERTWSRNQLIEKHQDDSVTLTLEIANFREGLSWVLGFGENAVVMEPDWFVKEVRRALRHAARNYRRQNEAAETEQNDMASPEKDGGQE